jgi:hypothetical protein
MRVRGMLPVSIFVALLVAVTICCGQSSVEFDQGSKSVRQWVETCLGGGDGSGQWSPTSPKQGKEECDFLAQMNGWYAGGIAILSIEDRPSVFPEQLWVFLMRRDGGGKGYLIVDVANVDSTETRSEVVLIGVSYVGCSKPSQPTDPSLREAFEYCFWGTVPE